MDRAGWLRCFGLPRDPFDAPDARRDEVLALDPLGMLHVCHAQVHGATEVPHSCLVEGAPGTGRTALCMQLLAEDEHDAVQRPGQGRRVVAIEAFGAVAREVEHRSGSPMTVSDALDLVLHRLVPELVDEVLGVPNDGLRPRLPQPDPAGAIAAAGPAACRDLLLLQTLYDRSEDTLGRTARVRERFALSGGVLAASSGAWGGWLVVTSVVLALLLSDWSEGVNAWLERWAPAASQVWLHALPWIGVGMLLSAGLGLLGRWAVAGLLVRRRVHRARRSILVTDRDPADLAACINELRPADLHRVPRRGAIRGRLELLDALERLTRLLGWRSILVVVDGVDSDPVSCRAAATLLDERLVQRAALAVVMAAPAETLAGRAVPCTRVQLEWTPTLLRRLLQSRIQRCANRAIAPPMLDALFEPGITSAEIDRWLAHLATPRRCLDAMAALVSHHAAAQRVDEGSAAGEPVTPALATPISRATIERVLGRSRPE